MVYVQYPLPSESLEFGFVPVRGCPRDQPPVETLGPESPRSSGWRHSHMQNSLLHHRIKCVLWDSTGRRPLDACAWLSPDFAPCSSLAAGTQHPFAIIHQNHEYQGTLSPVSPSHESSNLRGGYGDLWTQHLTNGL